MGRRIEALWDCTYCGTKAIGGLTKKCPCCGHPQDKDIKFYLPDDIEKKVLDEKTAEQYGKGADWMCSYCQSLNHYSDKTCQNCGADRDEQLGDYFSNKEAQEKEPVKIDAKTSREGDRTPQRDASPNQTSATVQTAPKQKKRLPLKFIIPGIILAAAMVVLFYFMPKNTSATLYSKEWTRSIAIEEFTTLQDNDWAVPDGGRVYDQQEEIHHYDKVIDHYETVSVAHSEEVLDGYDISYEYVNSGDGTFEEVEVSTPRYRTETYYEDEEQPVYVDVPVYQTKYYYEIDQWIESRTVDTQGQNDEPYWGEVTLAENERESGRSEDYWLIFMTSNENMYAATLSQDSWNEFQEGESYDITVQDGLVKKINGEEY